MENAVNLIILNDEGKILLIKRSSAELIEPDAWSIPGGRVEENENYETALSREIEEELGVAIADFAYFKSYFVNSPRAVRVVYFYGTIASNNIILNHESSSFFWFDTTEISDLHLAFNQKQVLVDFLEFKKTEKNIKQ